MLHYKNQRAMKFEVYYHSPLVISNNKWMKFTSPSRFTASDPSSDTAESFWVLLGCVEPPQVAVVISALIILTPNPSSTSALLNEYVPPSDTSSRPAFLRFSFSRRCLRFFSFSSWSSRCRLSSDQTRALDVGAAETKYKFVSSFLLFRTNIVT